MKRFTLSFFTLLLPVILLAQPVPKNDVAEWAFDRGLDLYRQQEYNLAHQRFVRVINDFPLHQKTTAAMLMSGKALYSQGLYRESADMLNQLITKYPDSRYLAEANRLRSQALNQGSGTKPEIFTLGIALPLRTSDAFTRALFNGIRLAVEEYNVTRPSVPMRMVFRDSGGESESAVTAVTAIIREGGAGAIIGPLFSQEATAAGEVAERSQVVMIAPVATDSRVSDGRRFVFQSSSTYPMRGTLMARYAMNNLGQKNFGILYETNAQNDATVLAFENEVRRLGGTVSLSRPLANATEWSRLSRTLTAANLSQIQSLYMPINGRDAQRSIETALLQLDQLKATVNVLGNSDWHDLPRADLATRYRTAYTSDFWIEPQDPRVRDFASRYQRLTGIMPDDLGLAYAGYDLAKFIITQIQLMPKGSTLQQQMRAALPYDGIGRRFDFRTSNQNEAVFYLRYRNGAITLDK